MDVSIEVHMAGPHAQPPIVLARGCEDLFLPLAVLYCPIPLVGAAGRRFSAPQHVEGGI